MPIRGEFVGLFKKKIRHFIGITGSCCKDDKEYYFYGVPCSNVKFWLKEYGYIRHNYFLYKHKFLKKITPFLNKIIN